MATRLDLLVPSREALTAQALKLDVPELRCVAAMRNDMVRDGCFSNETSRHLLAQPTQRMLTKLVVAATLPPCCVVKTAHAAPMISPIISPSSMAAASVMVSSNHGG